MTEETQNGNGVNGGEIMIVHDTALEVYGERAEVRELATRLMALHPAAAEVGNPGMLAVAQVSLMLGANPLPGAGEIQVWVDKRGRTCIQLGIQYYRRVASSGDRLRWFIKPQQMRPAEREQYGIAEGFIASICEGVRSSDMKGLLAEGYTVAEARTAASAIGVGVVGTGERAKNGRALLWTANKRAETDMMRQLYPAPFAGSQFDTQHLADMPEAIALADGEVQSRYISQREAFEPSTPDLDPFSGASPIPVRVEVEDDDPHAPIQCPHCKTWSDEALYYPSDVEDGVKRCPSCGALGSEPESIILPPPADPDREIPDAASIRAELLEAGGAVDGERDLSGEPITVKQRGLLSLLLRSGLLTFDNVDTARSALVAYVWGVDSLTKLTKYEARAALQRWADPVKIRELQPLAGVEMVELATAGLALPFYGDAEEVEDGGDDGE